jgi:hypothetical protein
LANWLCRHLAKRAYPESNNQDRSLVPRTPVILRLPKEPQAAGHSKENPLTSTSRGTHPELGPFVKTVTRYMEGTLEVRELFKVFTSQRAGIRVEDRYDRNGELWVRHKTLLEATTGGEIWTSCTRKLLYKHETQEYVEGPYVRHCMLERREVWPDH